MLCRTQPISDCFEENKLYVGGDLPFSSTLDQCFKACQSVTACEVNLINMVELKIGAFRLDSIMRRDLLNLLS